MNTLIYLLQVNLYLLLFYLFYLALLRNETFFKMNRFYLVGSAFLSLVIPVLKAEWIKELFITEKVQAIAQTVTYAVIDRGTEQLNTSSGVVQSQSSLPAAEWLWLIYAGVCLVFLLNFLRRLYGVNRLFKMNIKGRAFSFFSRIAVDEALEGKELIINHERVHAKQWHSADVIFFELLLIMNWFNPVAYLYRKAIKNIHEFIADELAASTLEERSAYALLLVSNVFNTEPQRLTNNFFNQSLLQRRIIMLHKTKSRKIAILKYGLSAPLFATMLIFSSATGADIQTLAIVKERVQPLIEKLKIAKPEPAAVAEAPVAAKATKPTDTTQKAQRAIAAPKNLYDYVGTLYDPITLTKAGKEGNIYVSFKVGEDKRPTGFKIMKSISSNWEKDLIAGLEAFPDTVDMPTGKYHFSLGFAYGGNEDLVEISKAEQIPLFHRWKVYGPAVGTATEIEDGKEVHNTYVSFTALTDPIVMVDEKEVSYLPTKMGLKLNESIYPKEGISKALKGDKAVEIYGERARKGIIVIETKEKNN
ncbi:M56 family metallopeptidase [Pedobacter psychroterrae]|uniref:Peptidase M56 domain-containing protein n=1 Tax=Pedobacter psychroterrae TaxID=2530453 RepID=A0A4R0NKM6_9SPHI|nr:M56 family metallopeptidase [Pedobacter psychroterrae]TCD00428.1 hypothetical protein EZ437_14480 [Pedobacter psychroterrae]